MGPRWRPSEDALFTFADDGCTRTFRNDTGRDPFDDSLLTVGYFDPIPNGWRTATTRRPRDGCYLLRIEVGR